MTDPARGRFQAASQSGSHATPYVEMMAFEALGEGADSFFDGLVVERTGIGAPLEGGALRFGPYTLTMLGQFRATEKHGRVELCAVALA